MASNFILEKSGRVATLTFNRPEKRHPVNEESLLEMEGFLHQLRDDKNVRVMILTGSGNTFCGGADLSQIRGITDERERDRIFAPIRKQRLRLASRVASNECPPSSKKLSSRPTRSRSSTSANNPHRISSCGVRGAR